MRTHEKSGFDDFKPWFTLWLPLQWLSLWFHKSLISLEDKKISEISKNMTRNKWMFLSFWCHVDVSDDMMKTTFWLPGSGCCVAPSGSDWSVGPSPRSWLVSARLHQAFTAERSHFEAARRTQRKSQTKEGQKKFFVDRKVEILKVYVKVSCFVLIFQCPRCVIILTESDLDQFLTGKKGLKRKIGMSKFLDWNGSRVLKTCYITYSPHISICFKQCLDSGHKCLE